MFVNERNHDETWKLARHQQAIELMLRTAIFAITKTIPEELNVDPKIYSTVRLLAPIRTDKQIAAVVKISSQQAMNPSPQHLSYRVQILNNHCEKVLRTNFAKALCSSVPGTSADMCDAILRRASEKASEREQEYCQAMAKRGVKTFTF